MRRFPPLLALLGLVPLAGRYLGRRRDRSNVRLLALRLGCSVEAARRLYELSRVLGYGAAHEAVFGRPMPAELPGEARWMVGQPGAAGVTRATSGAGAPGPS